jgi:alkyl hydroperoxide reductase subunit AhpC
VSINLFVEFTPLLDYNHPAPSSLPRSELEVGEVAPALAARLDATVDGEVSHLRLADFVAAGRWVVLFFYPKDWTFVCPTEITAFNDAAPRFEALGCQVVAASTDTAESHLAWQRVPRDQGGLAYMVRRALALI